MRNGSRPEYYLVEGGLKLTRMRQSEWRRRWGIQGIVTLDLQVGASGDDGWSRDQPAFSSTANENNVGEATWNYDTWARFTNVTIPGGATIQVAYISSNGRTVTNDGAGVKTNIYASDEDDAVAPTSRAEHVADPRTTAVTAWDDVDFVLDTFSDSPSIVDVIQEVIDRGSWASGNALMILVDDDGSGAIKFYGWYSWDDTPAKAMKLHVEYSA